MMIGSKSNSLENSISPLKEEDYFEDRQQIFDGTQEMASEFTNHHVMVKSKEKSLKGDLKQVGFPPDIISKADEIFSQMDSGLKRGARRRQIMYFCVQTAYNLMKIPEDPTKLAAMCGISNSEISKAFSMCSKTNYKTPSVHWEPQDFIKTYYQKLVEMDIISYREEVLTDIENICTEVMSKKTDLKDEKPQTVAAALVVFYLQLHNCAIEKKKYPDVFGRSEMTLAKVKNRIALAYNS